MDALKATGLARSPSVELQVEYPGPGSWTDGRIVSGYIDLVTVEDGRVDVIDFKTDMPLTVR
ncbi:MAG TPA: hypothetical protein VLJ79_25620 [Candidatus Binatia bacterium]|nr:hypothetical protein [Candidatus Binatia bacterium]